MSSLSSNKRPDALPPPPLAEVRKVLNLQELTIDWLAGDGSDRCYYRITSKELPDSLVLMQLSGADAAALLQNGYDWVRVAETIAVNKVSVPRLIATMPEFAALIIEDYGDIMLESEVLRRLKAGDNKAIQGLYDDCVDIVIQMLRIPPDPKAAWCSRAFDADRFQWELNFLVSNYVEPIARWQLSPKEAETFAREAKALSTELASYSHYFVHRDYHSRNVMYKNGKLAVIDFQDARLGPSAYDLVSLCFDSYVPFDLTWRKQMLRTALGSIGEKLGQERRAEIERHWRPMLLQRQLKAIGSFGYLTLKKNRGNYLKYVRPALATLEADLVYDKRWPFISETLVTELRSRVEEQP